MMLRSFVPLGVAMIFGLGCSARASTTPTVNLQVGARAASSDSQDHGEIWLWATRDKDDTRQTKTFRLAAEGSLSVLGEFDGIRILTSQGEWKWQAQEKEVKLSGCEHEDGSPAEAKTGTVMTVNLVNATGGAVQKIVESSDGEGSEIDDLQHHVTLLATIGPYLFIHESSYMYACGAHGNEAASAMVWDAEAGKTIDLWKDLPGKDKLADVAQQMLAKDEETDLVLQDETAKPEPAQFVPVYGEHGSLRLDAQFARWACYMCSDHEWSSYTRSAVVPTNWLPERMRSWAMPPVVVREFLDAHRDWRLGGWSKR